MNEFYIYDIKEDDKERLTMREDVEEIDKEKLDYKIEESCKKRIYNASVSNPMNTYNIFKQSVLSFIRKCSSLSEIDAPLSDILVRNCANILHHCNLLWSGQLVILYGSTTVQLPKDCNLRIYSSIYYVVLQIYSLIKDVDIHQMLNEFFLMDKSEGKPVKRKKGKEAVFFDNIHRFSTIIHRFGLGGVKYLKGLAMIGVEKEKMPRIDLDYPHDSPTIRFYDNLLHKFFSVHKTYNPYKEECMNRIEDAITNVILEGKGIRFVHMVCIYYIIVIQSFPEKKRTRDGKRDELSTNKLYVLLDDEKEGLYDKLVSHYTTSLTMDEKVEERKKRNFVKCLYKYIKKG